MVTLSPRCLSLGGSPAGFPHVPRHPSSLHHQPNQNLNTWLRSDRTPRDSLLAGPPSSHPGLLQYHLHLRTCSHGFRSAPENAQVRDSVQAGTSLGLGNSFDFLRGSSSHFVSQGDDNSCNLGPGQLGSPPKQHKPPLGSPRKVSFDENSPVSARRQLVPLSPQRLLSPPIKSSPRRQETPARSPARQNSEKKPPVARLFAESKTLFYN